MTAGQYLRELRQKRGYNKSDFQRLLGVAWTTVVNWEDGKSVPHGSNVTKIAEKLKLLPDEKAKLLELVREAARTRSPEIAAPTDDKDKDELDALLASAFDPARHTIGDAQAVLETMLEAVPILRTLSEPRVTASAWLDAASKLRKLGQRVTAPAIAALVVEAAQRGGNPRHKAAG